MGQEIDTYGPLRLSFMRINITLLSYDHGILRQVFDVMSDLAESGRLEERLDEMDAFVEFTMEFMDLYHHGKEERFVFHLADGGPEALERGVGHLRREHAKARELAQSIDKALADRDIDAMANGVTALTDHMRHHIEEEENEVFPELESKLTEDADIDMWQKSDEFVSRNFGADIQDRYQKYADELQERVWGKGVIKRTA